MYVQVLLIALCLPVLTTATFFHQAGDYPALVLFYEKKTESYTSVDLETIDQYDLLNDLKNRKVITCPVFDTATKEVLHDVLEINTEKDRCKYSYKPSMIENKDSDGYNVGFYFIEDKSIVKNNGSPLFSSIFNNTYDKPRMIIYEIETNHVTFEVKKTRHRIVTHKRFLYDIPKPCEKLIDMVQVELGEGLTEDISSLYSPKKEEKELGDIVGRTKDIFVPVQLVPIDDFTDNASRQATCTYFNTVPIWRTIAEIIRQIETYIRRLADVLHTGALEVVTRTLGVFKTHEWKDAPHFEKWYLDFQKKNIPVPRFFVKVIHYRFVSPDINSDDPNKYDYYMIVGVYNTSMEITEHYYQTGCNYATCSKYLWNLGIERKQNSKIFCCDIKEHKALEELGLGKIGGNVLDLNRIPVGVDENKNTIFSKFPVFR